MTKLFESPAGPERGQPVCRYFLDKKGVATQRMNGGTGKGHYEIAVEVLGDEQGELYARMAALGFARVLETTGEIHIECAKLNRKQRDYLICRSEEKGLPLIWNNRSFIESKDPRGSQGTMV